MARKKQTLLTNLELALMRVIWDADQPELTVREISEAFNDENDRPLAYTTVQTMLCILKDKGVVRSRHGPARAHLFSARSSRDEVTTSMVDDLVLRLFDGKLEPLLLHLIDKDAVSRDDLEGLRRFIDRRLDDEEEAP